MRGEFSMPAEWERHQATWISWPHRNAHAYPLSLEAVRPGFVAMVEAITESEEAWICVSSPEDEQWLAVNLSRRALERTRFFPIETNEPWVRDYGPTYLSADHKSVRKAIHWTFNAWGGKYPPYDADSAAGRTMAEQTGTPVVEGGIVFEGGALEVNGVGDVLTTQGCLLDPKRNPGLSESDAESLLRDRLGVRRVIWVPDVNVTGDDTDGHIDVTTRFTSPKRVLISCPIDERAPEFRQLKENAEFLSQYFEVDTLPMLPAGYSKIYDVPTPRSYANFYLTNDAILMPSFGVPEDDVAARILNRHFPDREIRAIDCRRIVEGQGSIHCLTQQVPELAMS